MSQIEFKGVIAQIEVSPDNAAVQCGQIYSDRILTAAEIREVLDWMDKTQAPGGAQPAPGA